MTFEHLELFSGACYVVAGSLIIGEHTVPMIIEKYRASLATAVRWVGGALGASYLSIGSLKLAALLAGGG